MATSLFWTLLAALIYPNLPNSPDGVWIGIKEFLIHVAPFWITLINIIMTDIQFIRDDWKLVFAVGLFYIPTNYFG